MQHARVAPVQTVADRVAAGAARRPALGNQARLRRLAPTIQRKVIADSDPSAVQVSNMINDFCPGVSTAAGRDVTATGPTCTAKGKKTPGCDCACEALTGARRTFTVTPTPMIPLPTMQKLADGTTTMVPTLATGPHTSPGGCSANESIVVPRHDSTAVFGSFDEAGEAKIASTPRILAHELCGHGVKCQTYVGDSGDRQQHDSTIATENAIYAPPKRGSFKNPRQGESFFRAPGETRLVFRLKDGLHYENTP